jgi:hypothetical protein
MPLNETDLKDTESYKKASRSDLAKIVSGNPKFWVYKDVELPNASGKKQKYSAFLVLVDDNGVRKAMTGKKLICKGTCGVKDERIAFEASDGKVPYNLLKVSVPLLLGKAVWVPTGSEEAGIEEEVGEAAAAGAAPPAAPAIPQAPPAPQGAAPAPRTTPGAPPTPPGAPPLTAASQTGAWSKLTKDVQAYATAHPERKADLFREMSAIGALLKDNKAAEAKPKMERLQAALEKPPEAPPAKAPSAAQLAARWTALTNQMRAAVAARPEKKAEFLRAGAEITDLIRTGKLDQATKRLDVLEQALKVDPKEREYRARYQSIEGRLAAALKDPARDASALRAMNAFVVEKANAGEYEAALKALLKMEETLTAKPAAGEAGKPKPEGTAKDAEGEGEQGEDEDEEEKKEAAEFQKDVKAKMVAAMSQVRTLVPREGEKRKPQMRFMAYLAGKGSAVLVAKKVGGGSKKVLAEIAGVTGGQIVMGECIFEKSAHTFVLENVPGGLAKKLAAALLAETGTKYKVRVRNADSSVDLDDETDVDPDETGTKGTNVRFARLRLQWDSKKKAVAAELESLRKTILEEYNDKENAAATTKLNKILARFNTGLGDTLDALYNAADPAAQQQFKDKSLAIAKQYLSYVESDPLIAHVEDNPFLTVTVRDSLAGPLKAIQKELEAAA